MKKIIKITALLSILGTGVISCSSNNVSMQNDKKVKVENKMQNSRVGVVNDKLYTRSSNGTQLYKGQAQDIIGYISIDISDRTNRKEIGKIGRIDENGNIIIELPEYISNDMLTVANETPTGKMKETVAGGVLITEPNIQIWKSDNDIMILTYLERDYRYVLDGVDYGMFSKGWNYAKMSDHKARTDYADYKWVIMD